MKNPFVTNGYAGNEYFCDRVAETADLRQLLRNENNIALISPRRLGKTELINHVFDCDEFRNDFHCFVVDIYASKSLNDLVNLLGKAVLDTLRPKGKAVWEKFLSAVSSLRPEISFDINGQPSWSIGIGELRNPVATLDEIFSYLQNADKPCILAIDEFQQITKYPETTVEATIRTYVQKTTNAHFIFSGSQRHLMTGMFTSPSRPFYQSVTIINLQPIPLDKYTGFTVEKFEQGGKKVAKDVVSVLYERFDGVTSYIHRVLNILYSRTEAGCMCESGDIDNAVDFLVRMSSDSYESLLYQMPLKQRDLLLAIASEGKVSQIMGGKFIKKHSLLSSSSVSSALKGLLDKDFVTEDKGTYSLYDKFFVLWLEKRGLIDRD
ncbi:MAG: ATPase [Rikenellaceae bacterium]|nr:ATPase [Rikenellaceae bacterium]